MNGTVYEIGFAKPVSLNWLLNVKITVPAVELKGSFMSDGKKFTSIYKHSSGYVGYIGNTSVIAYQRGAWTKTEYRTLIFLEEPAGEMLAWLEQNGVPL